MSPLFGPVSAGGVPKATVTATTGSPTIDTSSRAGKTIYKFTGSGTITIGTAGSVETLIVGGGGGGGGQYNTGSSAGCGGGGGGGILYSVSTYLEPGTYTIQVGAGGTISQSSAATSSLLYKGKDFHLQAFRGGRGATGPASDVTYDGGSGGGAGYNTTAVPGANAQYAQGNNGGGNTGGSNYGGGGGGGAAAAGSANSGNVGGAGGAGQAITITGSSVTYAGGGGGAGSGGGGAGGAGGGAAGQNSNTNATAPSATANTGGGGGGNGQIWGQAGGAGGSGIVIVVAN